MDPAHRGWPPQPPPTSSSAHALNGEQNQSQPGRPGPSFSTAQHQTANSPPLAPGGLPPPHSGTFPFHQPSHNLASLAGITQSSPRQPAISTSRPEGPQTRPSQPPGFPLPGISHATGQPGTAERERERAREAEQTHIKEEEDRRYREEEHRRLDHAPPHQPQGGPMIHQPVAVGPPRAHAPNGILSTSIAGSHPQPQMPLGAPTGPGNIFAGGPVQPTQGHQGQQLQPALLMPFAPGAQPQATQQQISQGQGQGQQPILNDALSYLDQVKVQFADHPDVYNRFLDIMKDFKSGAIDTPGVIGRVSTLFAGNPELIQGFNTFLPPGYRIECGTGDDPNAIRVTTPMGTTVQSMPQPRPLSRQDGLDNLRPTNGTFTPQPGGHSAQMMFSPSGRPVGPSAPAQQQHMSPHEAARQQEQLAMHAQEQRGVNSLQNAVSAATGVGTVRAGVSPRATPIPLPVTDGGAVDAQTNADKRGPVEFNHAISYVNKIKNRFSAQPDIYKQFLEILQTYQRESKPIQDVYSQVTHLFKAAPDLLEDFKQFLPESAAHAKAAERARREAEETAMVSHMRETGGMYQSPILSREAHMATPTHGARGTGLPPVGNFAPTPIAKDNKKRKPERQGTADSIAGLSSSKAPFGGQQGKRQKQVHPNSKGVSDQPPPSPSLVPQLPAPIPPTMTSAATNDELAFFDRAKKVIGNKNTMTEFLKLCNLFSQDFIDASTLVYRARSFIGSNPDLMKWFEDFIGRPEEDIVHELKPRIPTGRVSLSNCRGLGPSYRLLPKRERQKLCSGRDELCNAVLNDEWASHPTWASEDSGFIAHRKNMFEEALHRIEEERHDYDYNVEACARTIQLLEPIAQQLRRMSDAEQAQYKLPPGLGGQSETIYKRIIMKIYGRERGQEAIEHLHAMPYSVIPVLLNRLKERLESWKMAQREWEKVWREQTQKMFWKSLDHQAVNNNKNDRRQFQTKSLQTDIAVKHEEMRRQENQIRGTMQNAQMEYLIEDVDVLVDVTHLLAVYVQHNVETDSSPKLGTFIKEFVPLFFGLDTEVFDWKMKARGGETPPTDHAEDPGSGAEDSGSARGKKSSGKTSSLLRSALDPIRGRKVSRKDREESNTSGSRASTPDIGSNAGDPYDMTLDNLEDHSDATERAAQRWFEHPELGNSISGGRNVDPNEPQKRNTYRMWANTPLYCFMRMLVIFYERLYKLKISEEGAARTIRNAMRPKPAMELGIIDKLPTDFFSDVEINPSSPFHYYNQMIGKFEQFVMQDAEFVPEIEEPLRRYYLQSGYPLYPFEKLVQSTVRFAATIVNGENKDKSWDIYQLFKKDRLKEATTIIQQTDYKKAIEKMIKDGDLYRVNYVQQTRKVGFYLVKKDDPAYFDDGLSPMDAENRWRAYVASYQSIDDTDALPREKLQFPFNLRNMRAIGADPKSLSYPPSPPLHADSTADGSTFASEGVHDKVVKRMIYTQNEEKMTARVAVNGYKMHFEPGTYESWIRPFDSRESAEANVREADETMLEHEEFMKDHYVLSNAAMKEDMTKEEVERKNEWFSRLKTIGVDAAGDGEKKGEEGIEDSGSRTDIGEEREYMDVDH